MRVLSIPCRAAVIAIAAATISASPIAAQSSSGKIPPRRWVARVCAEVAPVTSSAVDDAHSWPTVSASSASLDDIVDRVRVADRAFGGLVKILQAMRVGMRHAGTPAVAHGEQVVADTQRLIGRVQAEFQEARDAIARFEHEFSDDPGAAMDELRGVFAGGLELDLPSIRWPDRLSSAFDRSPRCEDARRTLDEFVDLVHRKIGG